MRVVAYWSKEYLFKNGGYMSGGQSTGDWKYFVRFNDDTFCWSYDKKGEQRYYPHPPKKTLTKEEVTFPGTSGDEDLYRRIITDRILPEWELYPRTYNRWERLNLE